MLQSGRVANSDEPIDLGISSLIGEKEQGTEQIITEPPPPTIDLAKLNDLPAQLISLTQAKNWSELAIQSEKIIGNRMEDTMDSNLITARIFWVRSQVELKKVPVSILAAPLDSVASLVLSGAQISQEVIDELKALMVSFVEVLQPSENLIAEGLQDKLIKLDPKLISSSNLESSPINGSVINGLGVHVLEKSNTVHETKRFGIGEDSHEKPDSVKSRKIIYSVTTLLVLATVWYLDIIPWNRELDLELSKLTLTNSVSQPNLQSPIINRIERVKDIDAIYYGINNITEKTKLTTQASNTEVKESVKTAKGNDVNTAKASTVPLIKEKVDTSYPVEGTVFYPALGSSKISSQKAPVAALPVQKLPQNVLYTIITETTVMSQPSLRSTALSNLDPGARVEVIEKVGQWLKVRSQKGSLGYVLAQDAESLPLN